MFSNIDFSLLNKVLINLPTIGGSIALAFLLFKMCTKLFQFYQSEINRLHCELDRVQRLLEANHEQRYNELKMKSGRHIDETELQEIYKENP